MITSHISGRSFWHCPDLCSHTVTITEPALDVVSSGFILPLWLRPLRPCGHAFCKAALGVVYPGEDPGRRSALSGLCPIENKARATSSEHFLLRFKKKIHESPLPCALYAPCSWCSAFHVSIFHQNIPNCENNIENPFAIGRAYFCFQNISKIAI